MTETDIDRIIAEQGYTSHIDVRTTVRGDGTTHSYVCLRKQGLRRSIRLAAMTKLLKMSEADLVALINAKTTKSVQGAAQKGKE